MKHVVLGLLIALGVTFYSCTPKTNKTKKQAEQSTTQAEEKANANFKLGQEALSSKLLGSRELGRASSGEVLNDSFSLTNNFGESMVITKLSTDCGCIQMNYGSGVVKANEKVIVKYSYNTGGKRGQQLSTIKIHTTKGEFNILVDLEID